ncbi:MAG: 8-oxo-dGTP diphosphatase [Lentisphaeria bacterium]|nr:8-oxo-dGTP diphosphatase [Lentisphaeria bacterium]
MILATLAYLKKDNQTLMIHRVKKQNDIHEGKWNGLGGKFENGESPEDCVIREVEEESGFKAKAPKLHGFIAFPKFKDNEDWHVFIFTITEFEGTIIDSDEGNLEWIDDDKIMDLNLWPGDRIFIPWIIENKPFFSAKFEYENKELVRHEVNFY